MGNRNKDNEKLNKIEKCILGSLLVVVVFFMGAATGCALVNVGLDQETADDVCKLLTNNTEAVASAEMPGSISGSKLICDIPDNGPTRNIIIKTG